MIHEITTNKFTGLAVLVPEDFEYAGANNNELFYWTETCKQSFGDYPHSVHVTNAKQYEPIAVYPGLTEEQAAEIMPEPMIRPSDGQKGFMIDVMDIEIYPTAVLAVASLMQSIGCEQGKQYVILRRA